MAKQRKFSQHIYNSFGEELSLKGSNLIFVDRSHATSKIDFGAIVGEIPPIPARDEETRISDHLCFSGVYLPRVRVARKVEDDGRWHYAYIDIDYSNSPSLHACDWRCQRAKGNKCECACRGLHHGRGDGFRIQTICEAA